MSEVRLVVRAEDGDWSGTIHGSGADRAVAALSADPTTLAELETACGRYAKASPPHRLLANLRPGMNDEPYDAGLVVIDLMARLVAVDSMYSSPRREGHVCYHDGHSATDTWLRYHLADDWYFTSDALSWRGLANHRRRERAARPPCDEREVFYGKPLLEYLARETFTAFPQRGAISTPDTPAAPDDANQNSADHFDQVTYDTLKQIHAAWLLTPRDDLRGARPREIAVARRKHLGWDLQDQSERWSLLNDCPPGLDKNSHAFRHAGFGTHELVVYYELVRLLLRICWGRLEEMSQSETGAHGLSTMTPGDFLTSEVPRLAAIRDEWFDSPDPVYHGRTPRQVIDRERARLPEGISGREAMVDADCPCCQMMAEMPGPAFWHLDGCNMDDEFAFDIQYATRAEWEAKQREWAEFNERFNAEWAERQRRREAALAAGEPVDEPLWKTSDAEDNEYAPPSIRLFGIAAHLGELLGDLGREAGDDSPLAESQRLSDDLNRHFGNLHSLFQSNDAESAVALLQPVMDRFADALAAMSSARPELTAKCELLKSSMARLLEPTAGAIPWDDDGL